MKTLDALLEEADRLGLRLTAESGRVRATFTGSDEAAVETLLRALHPFRDELAARLAERPIQPVSLRVVDRRDVSEASDSRRFDHNGEEIDEQGMRVFLPAKRYSPTPEGLAESAEQISSLAARSGFIWSNGRLVPQAIPFQGWLRR